MATDLPLIVPPVRRFNATGGICLSSTPTRLNDDPALVGEAYRIELTPNAIIVVAGTAVGHFRAQTTLQQLQRVAELPCGVIEDAPEKPIRGLMLDVSRNRIYSLETLYWVVDKMAELKLNRLELYFENVFAYAQHPTAWAKTTPYTAADMQALSTYCHERFIDLVPNQNTLGHFERWLKADERYRQYFELPQGGARTPWGSIQETPTGLCTTDPEVLRFTSGLLNELLPAFPHASVANLGGDEVFDLGQGRSAGKGDKADLYLNYMAHMVGVAAAHGLRSELWADMLLRHPEILARANEVLPDVTWLLWGYEATDPLLAQAEQLRAAGLRFIVSPGSSSWRSFCGRVTNMEANIRTSAKIECDGLLLTDWGDAGHWQPLAVTLPALTLAATLAWNKDANLPWADAIDHLSKVKGLGDFLLRLGRTCDFDPVKVGNVTRLFRDYNLPKKPFPDNERPALMALREELLALEPIDLGDHLLAREAKLALGMQRLAVERALGFEGLAPLREHLIQELHDTWFARGPSAQWSDSRTAFLSPDL